MAKHTIESPVKDFNGTVVGVQFTDGKASTDNEGAIAYFERQGYTVAGEVLDEVERDYPLGDPSDKWTIKQLTAYATERQIDLGKAKSKDEVWNAIKPGGTPYKGVTEPDGTAIVAIQGDLNDESTKLQADLPDNVK
ncbi:hypothetical protein [Mycetocola miduiensis]|uniref:Uncharacterized protein n=1 Tax=Mycetocola miduiensis TaxID=995034 RepID=A0A1I5AUS2_9MICO|nr:hypothetical protein [Mycetocola miduiensis]SFN66276.1 hypothetical protein SAMN05216219_1557 [Mycetocola miduiensis]